MWWQKKNWALRNMVLLPYGTNGKSKAGDNPRRFEIKAEPCYLMAVQFGRCFLICEKFLMGIKQSIQI